MPGGERNNTRDLHRTRNWFHCGRWPHLYGRGDDLRRKWNRLSHRDYKRERRDFPKNGLRPLHREQGLHDDPEPL